jgi:hypothetical protein
MYWQGRHWALQVWPFYVNVPYWPHRIIVLGAGRLFRGRYYGWLPCCFRMKLRYCCERS